MARGESEREVAGWVGGGECLSDCERCFSVDALYTYTTKKPTAEVKRRSSTVYISGSLLTKNLSFHDRALH